MTVRPTLTNADVVRDVLVAEYPPLLRDAGIGGSPVVWIHIATTGEVDDARVFESSGFEPLDRAAIDVARAMRFTPAMNGDAVTDAWVQIPIRFAVPNN
jgi:protein TonB